MMLWECMPMRWCAREGGSGSELQDERCSRACVSQSAVIETPTIGLWTQPICENGRGEGHKALLSLILPLAMPWTQVTHEEAVRGSATALLRLHLQQQRGSGGDIARDCFYALCRCCRRIV